MRMTFRGTILTLTGVFALGVVAIAGAPMLQAKPKAPPAIAAMQFAPYEAQRVVYHVTEGEAFYERRFKNLLHVARNHVAAVGAGKLELRVLMQGGGVDLLGKARTDQALGAEVDKLKAVGVKFLICRNTLVLRGIDPATDLYGVRPEDIVASGIAEAAHLIGKGHVYLKL